MNRILSIILVLLTVTFGGCNQVKVRKNLLPSVSGSANEVLIVMDKKFWDDDPGKDFKVLLQEDMPGLPQSEPLFNLVQIKNKAFTELFRIHRNIILTQIDPAIEKPGISVAYDKWAQPQLVITMVAKNSTQFNTLFDTNNQKILSLLFKAEQDRLINRNKKYNEGAVSLKLQERVGISLTLPKGYTYDVDTNNFIWLGYETSETIQGIFVYYYPYKDTTDFDVNRLIEARNKYLKLYVPGENRGSYMTTELQVFPLYRSYTMNGKYTAELRGLWRVEGDFMGGPFVSVSQLDDKRNRIVTVEGFVYAPKYDKRNYVRELEAILSSMKFVK